MKIILATGIFPPDIGGPATYTELLAQELTKRNIEVNVICYSDRKEEDNYDFQVVRILRSHILPIRYFLYFWHVLKLDKSASLVYVQGPIGAGIPSFLACKILRKKYILRLAGDYAWEQGSSRWGVKDNLDDFQKKTYSWQVETLRKIQKYITRQAEKVIVPSNYLKKIALNWKVPEDNIEVIYSAGPEVKKKEGKLKLEGDVIISAGRLVPWKGMDRLVTIMPELLKKNPKFRLIIVGTGPEWEKLKFRISKINLKNKIRLIDKLPRQKLMEYFQASIMFVLNTGYEGLPHIILEAMAMGLPVITTNVCGNPEVVKNGYNGLLVEYNNKEQLKETILKLWRDKELRKKLIKNGKKMLNRFSEEKMIKKTLKILGL